MVRTIGILSGKGGVGKTTVAVNLACSLGLLNKKVSLVDLNFTTSHLTMEFGIVPNKTLNNLLRNEASAEEATYSCFNIRLIPASLSLSDLTGLDPLNIKSKLDEALSGSEIAILDSAPGFGREALASVQLSNEIIFVTNPNLTSVADIIKCKSLALKLGVSPLGVVVNKYRKKSFELSPDEITRISELPLLAVIKENENFLKCEAKGMPLLFYKRNEAEEFMKLACLITGTEYKKPAFFDRLLSKLV
ncbi:MAG TPA: P-loop NTPase [archaeon]|nr:P-loop NTPase [archaeon]